MLDMVVGDKSTWNLITDVRQSNLSIFRGIPMVGVLKLRSVDGMVVRRKAGVVLSVSENWIGFVEHGVLSLTVLRR